MDPSTNQDFMESYKGVLHVAQMGTSRHFWTSSGRYLMKLIAETGRDFMRVFFREVLDFLRSWGIWSNHGLFQTTINLCTFAKTMRLPNLRYGWFMFVLVTGHIGAKTDALLNEKCAMTGTSLTTSAERAACPQKFSELFFTLEIGSSIQKVGDLQSKNRFFNTFELVWKNSAFNLQVSIT